MKKRTKKILGITLGATFGTAAIAAASVAFVACGSPNYNQQTKVTLTQALDNFVSGSTSLDGSQTILPSQITSGLLPSQDDGANSSQTISNLWNSMNFRPLLYTDQFTYSFKVIQTNDKDGTLTFSTTIIGQNGQRATTQPITVAGFLTSSEYTTLASQFTASVSGNTAQITSFNPSNIKQTLIIPRDYQQGGKFYPITSINVSSLTSATNFDAVVMSRAVTKITGHFGNNVEVVKINHDSTAPLNSQTNPTGQQSDGMNGVNQSSIPSNILLAFPATTTFIVSDDDTNGIYAMINRVDSLGNLYTAAQAPDSVNTYGLNLPNGQTEIPTQTVYFSYNPTDTTDNNNLPNNPQPATPTNADNLINGNFLIYGGQPAELSTGWYINMPTSFVNPGWIKDPLSPLLSQANPNPFPNHQTTTPATTGAVLVKTNHGVVNMAQSTDQTPPPGTSTSGIDLWITPPAWQQKVWFASMQQLYNANFPLQYRFNQYGSKNKPLIIQHAPAPLPPTGYKENHYYGSKAFPVQYWTNQGTAKKPNYQYQYYVAWGNTTPDPYYYNSQAQGDQFFGKYAVIYTTTGGTWQYSAEAYWGFGYVNTNTDWGYDSNGDMFLTGSNLNIAQGLFANNNGRLFLAALSGGVVGSAVYPYTASQNYQGSINGNAIGMPVPWEFLALPESYAVLSQTPGSTSVSISPNIYVYGECYGKAQVGQLNYVYVPSSYSNSLVTLLNSSPGIGNLMSGGKIIEDTNNQNYVNSLATFFTGITSGKNSKGLTNYSADISWSGHNTFVGENGQVTTTAVSVTNQAITAQAVTAAVKPMQSPTEKK